MDDVHGVITAVETTPGSIAENHKLMDLVKQHEANTRQTVATVVADSKYGTAENLAAGVARNVAPHLGLLADKSKQPRAREHCFELEDFTYDALTDTDRCPAGQTLTRRRYHERRRTHEYTAGSKICGACPLRRQCTTGQERTVQRHQEAARVELGRQIARSAAARRDRRRRQHLMEGSFAQAANEHGFKRSRWRRLWRQQIQDCLIAAVQNVKALLRAKARPANCGAMATAIANAAVQELGSPVSLWLHQMIHPTSGRDRQPVGARAPPFFQNFFPSFPLSRFQSPFGQHALDSAPEI